MGIWEITYFCVGIMIVAIVAEVYRARGKGAVGEFVVKQKLKKLSRCDYRVIHDILFMDDQRSTQIDFLVVSKYGIFVIEVKNYTGWISGKMNAAQWTQTIYRKKSRFMNPFRQNYGHIKAVENHLKVPESQIISLVVFPNDTVFKVNDASSSLLHMNELVSEITRQSHQYCFSEKEMEAMVEKINRLNQSNRENLKKHIQSIREKKKIQK